MYQLCPTIFQKQKIKKEMIRNLDTCAVLNMSCVWHRYETTNKVLWGPKISLFSPSKLKLKEFNPAFNLTDRTKKNVYDQAVLPLIFSTSVNEFQIVKCISLKMSVIKCDESAKCTN